jgi:AcrR family transcriptional regulator
MSSENLNTRDRILNAAWRLLEENPRKNVRMSDIAKKAEISRQAVYLHFTTRAELLIATTRYLDDLLKISDQMVPIRTAQTGVEAMHAFIDVWGNHIPQIYGIARALLVMKDVDAAANEAWQDRMNAVHEECEGIVHALNRDGALAKGYTVDRAADILSMLLSVRNWEQLTLARGWSQAEYVAELKTLANRAVLNGPG